MSEVRPDTPAVNNGHKPEAYQAESGQQAESIPELGQLFDQFKEANCQLANEIVIELGSRLPSLKRIASEQPRRLANIASVSLTSALHNLDDIPTRAIQGDLELLELYDALRVARTNIHQTVENTRQQHTDAIEQGIKFFAGGSQVNWRFLFAKTGYQQVLEEQTHLLETSQVAVDLLATKTIGKTALEPLYEMIEKSLTRQLELFEVGDREVFSYICRLLETGLAKLDTNWQQTDNPLTTFRQELSSYCQTAQAKANQLVDNCTAERLEPEADQADGESGTA